MRTGERVTGIIRREGKLLLIHRFKEGREYWVFPGGGVEEGESREQALRREMLEETGLELLSYQFLYASTLQPGCLFYDCTLAPGEPWLGGPELEAHSPDNQFILEWVDLGRAVELEGLYPLPDRARLLAGFAPPG
jgi:8-oxo-dGTP diphosphatase